MAITMVLADMSAFPKGRGAHNYWCHFDLPSAGTRPAYWRKRPRSCSEHLDQVATHNPAVPPGSLGDVVYCLAVKGSMDSLGGLTCGIAR